MTMLQQPLQNLQQTRPLVLVATLGVVYGDIGTGPLYVFRAIGQATDGHFDKISVLGSLSLIFWTLIIVVALKYALILMRAAFSP